MNKTYTLVEPGVKYFINASLKQCNSHKKEYYNILFNIATFIFIVGFISIFLFIKYKGKLTVVEKQIKMEKDKRYILEKIAKIPKPPNNENGLITNLPKYTNI